MPRTVDCRRDVRAAIAAARGENRRIGLVPTMGALHEGHLSLVRAARAECDYVVVTIFVNPTQFGPGEDLARYPRTLQADLESLSELGVELVFVPSVEEMYPPGFSTHVEPPQVAQRLEGACRPGHFRGVATVVLKLFQLVPADVAFFGQKDYQQLLVIRHMVRDLDVPIEVRMCPIVREPDGLAKSSRNRYLSDAERQRGLGLSRCLADAQRMLAAGERDTTVLKKQMLQTLEAAGVRRVDYVEIADPENLEPVSQVDRSVVALVAAFVGETRLIDNDVLDF